MSSHGNERKKSFLPHKQPPTVKYSQKKKQKHRSTKGKIWCKYVSQAINLYVPWKSISEIENW